MKIKKFKVNYSIVIPCLNEEDSIGICLKKINKILKKKNYEIIVVDNGCTDNSINIAKKYKARIVKETKKGYGNAIRSGINASKGEYLIFGDADNSYDFLELNKFITQFECT